MYPIVIIDAKRTAIGKFRGEYANLSAVELGTQLVKKLLDMNKVDPKKVDQFIFGNVYQAGMGQNTARQIGLKAGGRVDSTAMTVNQVCGSGMKAIYEGISAITMGNAEIVVAGGVESMSNAPFYAPRAGKMEVSPKLSDTLFNDGLNDAFNNLPMGITAENVAKKYHVTRQQQDEFAYDSHQKAHQAKDKLEKEIIPIEVDGEEITTDQSIRPTTTLEQMGKLRTVFDKKGTVTAGNSSPINDGAAAVILMKESRAKELDLNYVAKITGYVEVGIDPNYMGYAPYYAIKKYFDRYQTDVDGFDLFEVNEAFASQAVAVSRDLNLPAAKLNIYGGAIALGHPLGATGSRMIATLINSLQQEKKKTGLASLCIGGGMAMAMGIELI
ncbi:thiolase family protein [Companilactobacillus alimentarius]|uniref:acetyl-CoA C-acetyltransferase n=1 Tax=Companilactobacillus alimentarius DSM 20249 TaxID=1423720 RepID=A0A2K9HGN1_9LACO|nr:thiolase family protein [Companilactobacillus alimentarius]AUI71700.1 3-ketoacyl-CoA thiolase [Companilactobacillus alimentarius DSM 20249]KRK78284.1 Acetyl-CoA acetyltransferase [Companilactobacillus alimentarius DSM 20249]GEO44556.1 3-ketoacyl-CoA thiolase [Companilactobacillus alimentarius]